MGKHIHIHLHRRSADRKTKDTSLELALATKEVRRLQNAGVTGHYVVLQRVMRMLVGQGFGEQYAQKVAEEAMDLMFSAADAAVGKPYEPDEIDRDGRRWIKTNEMIPFNGKPARKYKEKGGLRYITREVESGVVHDSHFTQYDPREAHRLDDEIKEVEQQIAKLKTRSTVPPFQLADLEQVLQKLKRERAKYHDAAHDSKLEELEQELDALEAEIEKLEDRGQSPSRAQLDKRKELQGAIAVIKSARKTGDSSAAEIEKQIAAQERLIATAKSRNASEAVLAPMARRLGVLKEELEKAKARG